MNKIIIDPLTRVEGHGRIELILKDGRLDDVRVRMLESPRLFEKIVVGRKYDEVADLVCRICAICSAVHKLTSLEALEQAALCDPGQRRQGDLPAAQGAPHRVRQLQLG